MTPYMSVPDPCYLRTIPSYVTFSEILALLYACLSRALPIPQAMVSQTLWGKTFVKHILGWNEKINKRREPAPA
jgi:hypothetical protein